ncbi:MAG: OmpA family protein [Deltaproteobacteria bacterium]|nr:OmpA family protein [Deltaproteobacteria bacterium]
MTRAAHQELVDQLAAVNDNLSQTQRTLDGVRAELDTCSSARTAADAEWSAAVSLLQEQVATAEARGVECEQNQQNLSASLDEMSVRLDDSTEAGRACQSVLEETRRVAAQSLTQNHELNERLERLRAAEAEAARIHAMYQDLLRSLQSLIDAGQLEVRLERGRLVLQLPQNVLFDSGRAELKADGRAALARIGQALAGFDDRRFQVEGHTDNVPIRSSRYASNWELSTARALAVVKLLVDAGLAPRNLSAAGYGEFQPRESNETAEGRRLNRRIEIVLVPDLGILTEAGGVR